MSNKKLCDGLCWFTWCLFTFRCEEEVEVDLETNDIGRSPSMEGGEEGRYAICGDEYAWS